MISEYHLDYLSCQFCVGKNHCGKCSREIAETLESNVPGVQSAEASTHEGWMRVRHDGADPDAIVDAMDAIGVFLS